MNGSGQQKRSHAYEIAVVCLLNGSAVQREVQEAEIFLARTPSAVTSISSQISSLPYRPHKITPPPAAWVALEHRSP